MIKTAVDPQVVRQRLEAAYYTLDIPAEVERHTGTRLHPTSRTGKQFSGACPYPDCPADTDGFMVWTELTPKGCHYHCRVCKRAGDILKLIRDINGLNFSDACKMLGIPNPYLDGDNLSFSSSQVKRRTPEVKPWQLDELVYLNSIYERAKFALRCDRARAYLAERAIPFELAVEQELGYIPALSKVKHVTPELERFQRWCDRIVFPVFTPKGELGYCGRTLFLWEPGMDEDEHKKRLDDHNAQIEKQYGDKASWYKISRWKCTYQDAFFNCQATKEAMQLVLVEGAFDVLACKVIGIHNAIAIGTKGIDIRLLPMSVCSIVMGLDIDGPGSKTAKDLSRGLRRKGIDVQMCTPIDAKDWSAAYRIHGMQGMKPLIEAIDSVCVCATCLNLGKDTPAPYEVDGLMYCAEHCHC